MLSLGTEIESKIPSIRARLHETRSELRPV